mgnify:CR=1 FL=1
MKKKILAVALAAISMASTFAGCGGGYQGNLEDEYTDDGRLIINFFGHDLDSLNGLTPDSKKILDYVENKFQIKLETTTATVASSPTLLNQLIGGGDVPDMFIHFKEEPAYSKWLNEEYLFNYSEYLDDYPALKANFTALGSESVVKNYLGGDYYSFPIVLTSNAKSGELFTQMAMYYRRDWYQALVNKNWQPSSGRALVDPEDPNFNYLNFYDLCEGFTRGDPDGNGSSDTVGYGLNKDSGIYWWYPLLNMWNINEKGWEYNQTTGKWEPEILTERGKNAVMWIADMYDNGFINSNYNTTVTYEMAKSDFCSGKSGIICYNAIPGVPEGIMENLKGFIGKVANSQRISDVVRGMPVVTGVDGQKRIQGAVNNYGYMAINNDISETKKRKILEFMNWIFTEEGDTVLTWGLEGDHWEYAADGTTKKSLLPLDNNNMQHILKNDSIAPAAFRLKGIASWEIKYTNSPRSYVNETEQIMSAWDKQYLCIDELTFIRASNEYATIEAELIDKVTTVCKNIVANIKNNPAQTRENYWNALVNYWNDRGGNYINAINEAAKSLPNK